MSYDIDHIWSEDITFAANGKLRTVTGTTKGEQRVLKRLFTNPGDYIWHPEYGAGLPKYIGRNLHLQELEAVIRRQIALEAVVAPIPVPVVKLTKIANGVFVQLAYVDRDTNNRATLEFDLTK